jgi:hypothetical protein
MPLANGSFDFRSEVLPRLVATYESGKLVPFIGVGMSRPMCASWPKLIEGLEKAASISDARALTDKTAPEELIQRANRAVETLRRAARDALAKALKKSLIPDDSPAVPMQTRTLARIAWPLVLTTNYDNAYVKAFEDEFGAGGIAVVGRGPEDCQRVLNSLTTAGRTLLWALQGHIGEPFAVSTQASDRALSSEAVVDHAEYRRVTNREPHFRRAFAEVFRHRSFFFLGSGLRENYLQELFGEVLEIYGPSSRTHFAIMPRGEVDPRFVYERFQVAVVEYAKDAHGEPPRMLGELAAELDKAVQVPVAWSWGVLENNRRDARRSEPELEVVRGPLPTTKGEHECLVVSAGGARSGESFVLSSKRESTIRATLAAWGAGENAQPRALDSEGYVGEYEGIDAFAARARQRDADRKDLSQIAPASLAVFAAVAERHACIRMQLLAAGGEPDESKDAPWSVRPFPTRFSFIQTVRAWGLWRRAHPENRCRLALHLVDTALCRDIASGRIDVLEILHCDDIRIWAEVVETRDKFERRLFQVRPESSKLRELVEELCLTPGEWQLEVSPPPTSNKGDYLHPKLSDELLGSTLDKLFVVAGSTLHFRRVKS